MQFVSHRAFTRDETCSITIIIITRKIRTRCPPTKTDNLYNVILARDLSSTPFCSGASDRGCCWCRQTRHRGALAAYLYIIIILYFIGTAITLWKICVMIMFDRAVTKTISIYYNNYHDNWCHRVYKTIYLHDYSD